MRTSVDAAMLPFDRGGTAIVAGAAVVPVVLTGRHARRIARLARVGRRGAESDAEEPGETGSGRERRCVNGPFEGHL